eukprot:gene20991-23831_t
MRYLYYTQLLLGFFLVQLTSFAKASSISDGSPLSFEYFGDKTDQITAKLPGTRFSKASNMEYTKTGTTIVGICCRDGVVLGADTRSTGGPLVMDKNKLKIHSVSKYIRCCAAGTSADCTQITRKAGHHLGLLRIEHELSGESTEQVAYMDPVVAAVTAISNRIRAGRLDSKQQRKVESVLILGGVDQLGPALYQIDKEGVPQRVSFGALGSGATDALAVLEHERRLYREKRRLNGSKQPHSRSDHAMHTDTESRSDINGGFDVEQAIKGGHCEDISATEAVYIVRKAVQSGILNDLGSGSHVDLCVISCDQGSSSGSGGLGNNCTVRQWREEAVSGWDADRLTRSVDSAVAATTGSADAQSPAADVVPGSMASHAEDQGDITKTSQVAPGFEAVSSTSPTSYKDSSSVDNALGKRIFSRFRPVKRLVGDTVTEDMGTVPVDEIVAVNVELIE